MIYVVGQFPPPVHGFSLINKLMTEVIERKFNCVVKFDVAPRFLFGPLIEFFRFFRFILLDRTDKTLYLAFSGGLRQVLDGLFLFVALVRGARIIVHHHSFYYLNKKILYSRLVLALAKNADHVVLCRNMADLLIANYGIGFGNIKVLSNSYFIDPPSVLRHKKDSVTLGFLSNITEEKGIFVFFKILHALNSRGISVNALVAGPVDVAIKTKFEVELSKLKNVQYIGPVYGSDKVSFFSSVDALVFPTLYKNEAEPVTIWESFSAGVPVFAFARGCISTVVDNGVGGVASSFEGILDLISNYVESVSTSPGFFDELSNNVRRRYRDSKISGDVVINELFKKNA